MESTNNVGTINNALANDSIKLPEKTDIQVITNNNEKKIMAQGLFSDSGTIFPHENIINRALTIIEENDDIGYAVKDIRKKDIYPYGCSKVQETTFEHSLGILKLNPMGMALIAGYYKKKYNIDIYFITQYIQYSIGNLAKQLKNGEKIGVVAKLAFNHATPLIISKNNEKIYIITMDSLGRNHDIFWRFFSSPSELIEIFGTEHCHLLHAGIKRQMDDNSCINDAIIILKNALREPNLFNDLFNTSKTADATDDIYTGEIYQVSVAEFPKFLYKTAQNKELLDKLTEADREISVKQSTDISLNTIQKTLQTHLHKYNRTLIALRKITDVGSSDTQKSFFQLPQYLGLYSYSAKKYWQVNTYLHTKPYRMLVKSVEEITDTNGFVE